ncbi:MAG TPA: helix-turn-helix domain-containing protein [Nitrospiraceae bacterium]|jgi:two-component system nitrogen regulation response regulator GlnG|nr:helix-turn-helix domain-containing protein [Nitrospiraceae bacterium]
MSLRSSALSILLLSADHDIHARFRQAFQEAAITAAKDVAALTKEVGKRPFDIVVLEAKRGTWGELTELQQAIDPARTLVVAGSRHALKRASKLIQTMVNGYPSPDGAGQELSLESYIESKMVDFVRSMRNGSGRNLHPMLMTAVERPLIALALKETKGNQIQAAELLGLNRNTLRKKIIDLRIPVRRGRRQRAHSV